MSRQRKAKPAATPPASDRAPLSPDPTTPGDDVGPPLHGKTNPRDVMDAAVPTLDDEHRSYRHHPSENEAIEFEIDPLAGDAAADLAAHFGSQFLEGATRGEDLSAIALELDDASDAPLDLLLDDADREDEANDETGEAEAPPAPSPPRSSARRRPR